MKIISALFGATTILLLSVCGNSSQSRSANTDTSAAASNSASAQVSTTRDKVQSASDFMKAMDDMMGKMQLMKMTGDFDVDFANMMVEHHQGALDMAQVETSQGKDETMKAKAQEILTKQKQQELKDFVQTYKPSGMKHGEGEMQQSMSKMMDKMKAMKMTGDVDKDFATMMASHHEDGISMAKMELKNGMSDKLKQMAEKSIDDQQKDIKEFQTWLSGNK